MSNHNKNGGRDLIFINMQTAKQLYSQFAIIKCIGRGAYGIVYEALKKSDGSKCCIKRIIRKTSSRSSKTRLNNEINILTLVKHPAIIELYGIAKSPNFSFLIMELCEGGALSDQFRLLSGIDLGFSEVSVKKVVEQLTNALAYLHNRSIVHRDVKCANVLFLFDIALEVIKGSNCSPKNSQSSLELESSSKETDSFLRIVASNSISVSMGKSLQTNHKNMHDIKADKLRVYKCKALYRNKMPAAPIRIKLIDFGFAVELRKNEDILDECCGSSFYMAPEVLAGRSYTRQCDVWSLGIIVFKMLCNCFPFSTTNEKQYIDQVLNCTSTDMSDRIASHVSKQGKDFLVSILHPDPVHRMSAAELITHQWLKSEGIYYSDGKNVRHSSFDDNGKSIHSNIFSLMKAYQKSSDLSSRK